MLKVTANQNETYIVRNVIVSLAKEYLSLHTKEEENINTRIRYLYRLHLAV